MKYVIVLLTALSFFISCNTFRDKTFLSKPDEITPDEYVIDINRDTVLMTKHGALFNIPKGSLVTDEGNTVTLEIKEVYSPEQMIKTGLTTQSNGEMLSSGGMIFINARAGQSVTIKQAITVAVPADYLNPAMQLYKGEKEDDGTINWTDPLPLSENRQLNTIESGKQLFQRSCASCHSIGKDATGPDLAHFLKRFSGDKLLARGHTVHHPYWFRYDNLMVDSAKSGPLNKNIHISSELWDNQFLYFCNLQAKYGSLGTSFPDLDEEALNAIYAYIQNESDSRSLPSPSIAYLDGCIDSCTRYLAKAGELLDKRNALESKRNNLIEDNGPLVKETKIPAAPTTGNNTVQTQTSFEDLISPKNYGSVYYQFSIETFGWFNIDVLLKGLDGVEESELFIRIVGEYRETVQVYLIIPSVKVYVQGGPAERNSEEYAFLYKNGKLPLPQGAKAYIMAVTEAQSTIAYALKEFTTNTSQELEITLQKSTKESFNAAINSLSSGSLNIKASDSKNATEIRKSDADLKTINEELKKAENLKPKNCDCNCPSAEGGFFQPLDTVVR